MSRVRALVLSLLTLIPLALAAVYVGVGGLDPADTWTSATAEGPSGAPADAVTAADLVDARRAAGEASSQAGFLTAGTQELADGTSALREGAGELTTGATTASDGAQELADGMIQLQAGTANLGVGATEVADAVGGTVDVVVGVNVIRGQALGAIDRTLAELEGNENPEVIAVRDELTGLRDQLNGMEVATADMERLRDGSREIANQLTTPGFAFHDGIYGATNGASNLNMGLNDLETGLQTAVDSVVALDDGAKRVDDMADQTKTRIDGVNRAMPVVWASDSPDEEGPQQAVSPIVAMLIAALVMLVGLGLGLAAHLRPERRWAILLGGVLISGVGGLVALMVLSTGLTVTSLGVSALALTLGVLATAGVTVLLARVFGGGIGAAVAGVLAIAQVGVVGWVWRKASTAEVAEWAQVISGLMPLHWSTATLSAAGNQGDATQMWLGVSVLAVLAVLGLVAVATMPKRASA